MQTSFEFIEDLLKVIPNSDFRKRGTFHLKKIVEYAKNRDYTCLIVINEDRGGGLRGVSILTYKMQHCLFALISLWGAPFLNFFSDGALFINLPDGPTAFFKVTSKELGKEIRNHARVTSHKPELILNNFNTRLGHTIGTVLVWCLECL